MRSSGSVGRRERPERSTIQTSSRSTTRETSATDTLTMPRGVVTRTGLLIGTPRYMSPEQVAAEPVTGASDVFSLGVLLYEWTTGQYPFAAASLVKMLAAIVSDEPLAPARLNSLVPAHLDTLIVE